LFFLSVSSSPFFFLDFPFPLFFLLIPSSTLPLLPLLLSSSFTFFSGPLSSSFLQTFHFPVSSFRLSQFRLFQFPVSVSNSLLFPFLFPLSLSDSSYVLCCSDEVSIISDSLVSASSKVVTLHTHTSLIHADFVSVVFYFIFFLLIAHCDPSG